MFRTSCVHHQEERCMRRFCTVCFTRIGVSSPPATVLIQMHVKHSIQTAAFTNPQTEDESMRIETCNMIWNCSCQERNDIRGILQFLSRWWTYLTCYLAKYQKKIPSGITGAYLKARKDNSGKNDFTWTHGNKNCSHNIQFSFLTFRHHASYI